MKNEKSNNEKARSGKGKNIALAIIGFFLALLIFVGVFLWLNPTWLSHIKAAFLFLTNSKEKLESNIQKIENERIEAVQSSGLIVTKEAETALADGLITTEQFQSILLGSLGLDEAIAENSKLDNAEMNIDGDEQTPEAETDENEAKKADNSSLDEKDDETVKNTDGKDKKPADSKPSAKPSANPSDASANKTDNVDEQIASLVTRMYVLKANYVGQIDGVVGAMRNEFYKLPKEQQTKSSKQSIATKYISKINAMEAQCDAQVNAVVSELKQLLNKAGRDYSLADAIVSTYNAEKENTKAYYISTYGD